VAGWLYPPACPTAHTSHAAGQIHNPIIIHRFCFYGYTFVILQIQTVGLWTFFAFYFTSLSFRNYNWPFLHLHTLQRKLSNLFIIFNLILVSVLTTIRRFSMDRDTTKIKTMGAILPNGTMYDFHNSFSTWIASVTFFGGSEDLYLLRWQNLKTCCARSFGGSIHYRIIIFSVFAKVPSVFVPNAISHHGRPSQFVLICFNARRVDYSASLLIPII